MKSRFVLVLIAGVAAASYGGYHFGRSTLPVTIMFPHGREIISSTRANVTNSTSSAFRSRTHSSGYSVAAFMMVGDAMPDLLESVIGRSDSSYFVYLLPVPQGFHLIIHHDTLTPKLTSEQHDLLVERVEQRLILETAKYSEP